MHGASIGEGLAERNSIWSLSSIRQRLTGVASSAFSARHQSSALRAIGGTGGALRTQSGDDGTDDPSRFSMTSPLLGKVDIEQHEAEAINSCAR
eukprot:COSAG01_NODE_66_length_29241_cov_17.772768_3_plen_94_part_00